MRLTYWGQFMPCLVAMYSAGRHLRWRRAIWAIPMVLVGFAIAAIEYSPLREPGDLLFDIVVLIGLWAVGRLAASWVISRDRALALEFERGQVEERAATSERTRIARELHDLISHTITVIVMQAGGGRLAAATDPGAAVETLSRIEVLGRESLAELRTLLAVLHPDEPDGGETAPQPTLADLSSCAIGCARRASLCGCGWPVTSRGCRWGSSSPAIGSSKRR